MCTLFLSLRSWEEETKWVQLLRPFTTAQTLYVCGYRAEHVALALKDVVGEMVAELLPAHDLLCLEDQASVLLFQVRCCPPDLWPSCNHHQESIGD